MAREIAVTSWRELRGEFRKYADFIDHLPLEQNFVAAVSLAQALLTYIYFVKDKSIMTNKNKTFMQDDVKCGVCMNRT